MCCIICRFRKKGMIHVVNMLYMYILADFERSSKNAITCTFVSTKTNTRSEYACIQDAHLKSSLHCWLTI